MPRDLSKDEMESVWLFNSDGTISWIEGRKQVKAGDTVKCINKYGYVVVTYDKAQYKVHRLMFAYHKGYWPYLVDHKDHNRANNKIDNLRDCSSQQNTSNTNSTYGKSPYRGVSFLRGKPRAFIQANGNREFLGYFETEQQASEAYCKRRAELNPALFS